MVALAFSLKAFLSDLLALAILVVFEAQLKRIFELLPSETHDQREKLKNKSSTAVDVVLSQENQRKYLHDLVTLEVSEINVRVASCVSTLSLIHELKSDLMFSRTPSSILDYSLTHF